MINSAKSENNNLSFYHINVHIFGYKGHKGYFITTVGVRLGVGVYLFSRYNYETGWSSSSDKVFFLYIN